MAADGYQGIWSDAVDFNIIPPPPAPPVEKPEMGDKELRIRWKDLGEGITYRFQMAKDTAFDNMLVNKKLSEPEIVLEKPEDAGIYYVRTSGIDSEGYEGDFSEPQSYEVKSKFPFIPLGIGGALILLAIILM
jgi:hypothetical protein